jgi:hypothetical protein
LDSQNVVHFSVSKIADINANIIPFFEKYPLQSVKALEYADFCEVAKLINSKDHLTSDGLERISQIKVNMNRGRK